MKTFKIKTKTITVKPLEECKKIAKRLKDPKLIECGPASIFGKTFYIDDEPEFTSGKITCHRWDVPLQFIVEFDNWEINKDGDLYIIFTGNEYILNIETEQMHLSPRDFWAISRIANFLDTKSEVEEYLHNIDSVNGVSAKRLSTPNKVKLITEQVMENRLSEESGDQIYYAIKSLTTINI